MSTELLTHETPEETKIVSPEVASIMGRTVFERLAVDADIAIEQPEGKDNLKFFNSVTRLQDGQTIPDER